MFHQIQHGSVGLSRKDTLMSKITAKATATREISETRTFLDEIVRQGAQQMLRASLENEVQEYVARMMHLRDEDGRREVVRNGYLPERDVVTGVGPVRIEQPRVRDRRSGHRFTSRILPPILRRVPSIDAFNPHFVPEGDLDGGFFGGADGDPGAERGGAVGDEHRPAERELAGRLSGVDQARLERPAVCLLVGRQDLLQCSAGTGAAVFADSHGRQGGWDQRAGGRLGRSPR